MSRGPKITVAGAGAFGLAAALALADAGARVEVFDPAEPGDNASGVAAGMLAPVFEAVLDGPAAPHFDLLMAARDLWPALETRTDLVVDRSGAVALGDADRLSMIDAGVRRLGLRPSELERRSLDGLAGGLAPAWRSGLLVREDWRVEAAAALAAMRAAAVAAGVVFHRRAATGFEGADRLVIATGAASDLAVVAPELRSLTPIKGHILRADPAPAPGVVVRGPGAYVVAAAGGVAVGATMQPGAADREVEPEHVEVLRRAGARLFPALAEARFIAATGVRATTPDGLPLVGRGRHPGVLLAVGARRNGWLLAPLAARLIAACVTEGEVGPHAERLNPARFDGG